MTGADTPQDPGPAAERRGGLLADRNRVEAFSDGIFAIAITLLVLDLHPPTTAGRFGAALLAQWPAYLTYLASFAFIGVLWVNHHHLFSRVRAVDTGLLWANLALLLTSSVLPFPTAVLGAAFQDGDPVDQRSAALLYTGLAGLTAVAWLIIFSYLAGHPHLLQPQTGAAFFARERRRAALGIGGYAAAAATALILPVAALALCLALPLFYAFTSGGRAPR